MAYTRYNSKINKNGQAKRDIKNIRKLLMNNFFQIKMLSNQNKINLKFLIENVLKFFVLVLVQNNHRDKDRKALI